MSIGVCAVFQCSNDIHLAKVLLLGQHTQSLVISVQHVPIDFFHEIKNHYSKFYPFPLKSLSLIGHVLFLLQTQPVPVRPMTCTS